MDKKEFLKKIKNMGFSKVNARLKKYASIASFTYKSVYKNGQRNNYRKAFDMAYEKYGLYIFYDGTTNDILYVGEAATEPFSKRLSQHFNQSDGGLREKFVLDSTKMQELQNSEVLILYIKKGEYSPKEIHFDEDLLIGLLCPVWNSR